MNDSNEATRRSYALPGLLLIALPLLMAACATTKARSGAASQAITLADAHIQEAQGANAARYAPQEFQEAKDTLARAQSFFSQGKFGEAGKLADQAAALAGKAKDKSVAAKRTKTKSRR